MEELAILYATQSERELRLVAIGLLILGGFIAAVVHKGEGELRRAPYFAFSAMLYLISAASQFVWLGVVSAMQGGYIWALMLTDVGVSVASGYCLVVIAMARSRDIVGHGRRAFLAYIPFANFWLLFTPSRHAGPPNAGVTTPFLTGGLGVASGLVMFVAGSALAGLLRAELNDMVARSGNDPSVQASGVDLMIRANGLEAALKQMALQVPTPSRVDSGTNLIRVEGYGSKLRYVYEMNVLSNKLPDTLRSGLRHKNCSFAPLRPIIEAGATLEYVYKRADGSQIGVVDIDRAACGF